MANIDQPIKIKPVPYTNNGFPNPYLVSGETFDSSIKFIILSSVSLPKESKVYMEVTINTSDAIQNLKYIPLYFGIHKDPYSGILGNDYVLLSCFYTKTTDFHAIERKKGEQSKITTIHKILTKIPIVGSTIGLGIDMSENTVSIYTDGRLLYQYEATNVDFNDEDPWYFALYSDQPNHTIKGRINYGRYKTSYLPTGYKTLYKLIKENIVVEDTDIYPSTASILEEWVSCSIDIPKEEVDPYPIEKHTNRRYLYLEHSSDKMEYGDLDQFQMSSKRDDITFINLPCPADPVPPIYFELIIKEAFLVSTIGIPVEVGLTVNKTDYTTKSFRVSLYHKINENYKAYSVIDGEEEEFEFPSPLNASTPVQPNTIGFIIDRINSKISIITDGSIFVTIPIEGVDFSDPLEEAYIFFKANNTTYIGTLYGILHLGDEYIDYALLEDSMTMYDYWNGFLRKYLTKPHIELDSRIYVKRNDKFINRNIYSTLLVPSNKTAYNNFDIGLNTLFKTFNTVSDTKDKENEPDISYEDLLNKVKGDGRGI